MSDTKKSYLINARLLFDINGYLEPRTNECLRRTEGKGLSDTTEILYTAFPNIYREIDISGNFFFLKYTIERLISSGERVDIIIVMPAFHPDAGLAVTQYGERIKYFLGKELFKKINLITLIGDKAYKNQVCKFDYFIDYTSTYLREVTLETDCALLPIDGVRTHLLNNNYITEDE